MKIQSDKISKWADTLEDFKPEYTSVEVRSPIEFYSLIGRKSTIELDNFDPIKDLHYALYSPKEKRYYLKEFSNLPMWLMLFYKTDPAWDSYDVEVNNYRRYISDGNLFLLLTKEQIGETSAKLEKLWKANLKGEGKLNYRIYIEIVRVTLQYENYKDIMKNAIGFRTVCNSFDIQLRDLWKKAVELKR